MWPHFFSWKHLNNNYWKTIDKKHGNLWKKISCMQKWRRSHNKVVGKVKLQSNHIPYMLSGWYTIRKIIMQQTFSYRNENSESGNGRRNPERIYLWRPVGFDHRNSTRLGETETVLLEGTHRVLCAPGPRKKNQWPHKRLGETYLFVLEGILWRWWGGGGVGGCSLLQRQKHWRQYFWGVLTGKSPLGGHRFLTKTWPYPTACRLQCWDTSGQTTNKAGTQSPIPHQQISFLRFSWAQLCSLEGQDFASPTSGQELVPSTRKPAQFS